jgi:hypothetical protein
MGRCVGGHYGPETVDKALMAYIRTRNYSRTEEIAGVDATTVVKWTKPGSRHYERYTQLLEQYGPEIEAQAINDARGLLITYAEKERQALDALDLSSLDQRDIPGAIRNLATAKAINADKVIPLDGREHAAQAQRTHDAILEALAKNAPHLFAKPVDAEATEVDQTEQAGQTVPAIRPSAPQATRTS